MSDKQVRAWCLYDVANSAFTTTIVAAVLPQFFSSVAGADLDPDPEQARLLATSLWSKANTVTMLLTAVSAPFLGALADRSGGHRRILAWVVALGAALTASMVLIGRGDWLLASCLYVAASLAWSSSLVVYDGMLPHVASGDQMDRVSARGFAWGYLGGGILLAVQMAVINSPEKFGLADSAAAVRISFVSVALWWALFSIPLFRNAPRLPSSGEREALPKLLAETGRQLVRTFAELRQHRAAFQFLVAFWLYNDGIGTITRVGVIFGAELGIGRATLIGAILMIQILGFPFAYAFGWLAGRIGQKRAIGVGIGGYMILCLFALMLQTALHFWLLAFGVSMFQGGTQAISRSMFASMIPHDRSGEFFGFYNLSSKFAGILGTAMIAALGPALGSSRYAVAALVLLFAAGGYLLSRVPAPTLQRD